MSIHREDLDALVHGGCAEEGCGKIHDEMFLHVRCHPRSPTWATYSAETKTITIVCAKCSKTGVKIVVASKGLS